MRRVDLIVVAVVIMSTFYVGMVIPPQNVKATIRYVGGTNPGNYTGIQEAVDDSVPGDTIYVYNGTYYERITINKTLSLVGEDRNTTIIDGGGVGWGNVVNVTADWVNITEFTVTNSGVSGADAGIDLDSVRNCSITGNTLSNNDVGISVYNSDNNSITGNNASFNRNRGIGISFSDSANIIAHNILTNNRFGIATYYSAGDSIRDNYASLNTEAGIRFFGSNNSTIAGNALSNNLYAIILSYSVNNSLVDNTMMENGIHVEGDLLEHWNTHSIDISNTVNGKPVHYWKNVNGGRVPTDAGEVILANCTNVTVEGQNIKNGSVGIELGFSSGNVIAKNTVSGGHKGIVLWFSNNNTVVDNSISDHESIGTWLLFSDNNTISNNTISLSDQAIHVWYSGNNTISNNTISLSNREIDVWYSGNNTIVDNTLMNGNWGISLSFSSNITIVNNTISDNQRGLGVIFSENNRIYHNNFLDNAVQANDHQNTSEWDDGYPSGGNYWNDYNGIDNRSGPNQDQPGSDGIGDTPYLIDGVSKDRYPLMSPLGVSHPRPPILLEAVLTGTDFENVTLTWALSPDDGRGFKLVTGYGVYRNGTYDSNGVGYGLIASLPNGTSEFVDSLAGEGDPNNYFYGVCAVDLNNNTTCAEDQAGKFTRPLSRGLNLVSVPLVQSDESVEAVLQTAIFDKAWYYGSYSQEWESIAKIKPFPGGLAHLNHSVGFWINVTRDSNLTVAGLVPSSTTIHLLEGWNLMSFPSFKSNYTVADLKLETNAERIETFDQLSPPYHLRVPGDSEFLLTGFGYWVYVGIGTTWTVGNS